jgi:subtilase family serine protease
VSYTINNSGTGAARSARYDRIYLSDDNKFDNADILLLSQWVGSDAPLDAGASADFKGQVTIPAVSAGNKFLLFVADSGDNQGETDETNNLRASAISISAADLTIAGTAPASIRLGQSFDISWTTTNSGAGAAPAGWYDYVYLSTDQTVDAKDRVLASNWRSSATALASADHYDATRTLTLWGYDTQPGDYYLLFVTDPTLNQPEGNENNNLDAKALTIVAPNLKIESPTVPATANAGDNFTVTWTTKNSGNASAIAPWRERVVLSTDQYYGNYDDVQVGVVSQTADLAPNGTVVRSVTGTIPWGFQGNYTVFIKVDNDGTVPESNESDNVYSSALQVNYAPPPADLIVDAITIPDAAGTGLPIQVAWRVINQGTAATRSGDWSDRVYLSSDATFGNDLVLGTFAHSGNLGARDNYTQVQALTLPVDLPAGTYWIFVSTDIYNQLDEPGAEANNLGRSAGSMAVTLSPVPDLVGAAVTGPTSANAGQQVSVSYVVANNGRVRQPATGRRRSISRPTAR